MEEKNWLNRLWSWFWSCFIPFDRDKVFFFSSLAIAAYFANAFVAVAGDPPTNIEGAWPYFIFFLIFFLLPFAKKLDFFQFFSFEARIAEVKKEVVETNKMISHVQDDIRHVISQQQTLSASIKSKNKNVIKNKNYLDEKTVEKAVDEVFDVEPAADPAVDAEIDSIQDTGPPETDTKASENLAEYEEMLKASERGFRHHGEKLRYIQLRKRVEVQQDRINLELNRLVGSIRVGAKGIRYPRAVLIRHAMREYPILQEQQDSFNVFSQVGRSLHMDQNLPLEDLRSANFIQARLLRLLSDLPGPVPPEGAETKTDEKSN